MELSNNCPLHQLVFSPPCWLLCSSNFNNNHLCNTLLWLHCSKFRLCLELCICLPHLWLDLDRFLEPTLVPL